jgi:hypothetical protein
MLGERSKLERDQGGRFSRFSCVSLLCSQAWSVIEHSQLQSITFAVRFLIVILLSLIRPYSHRIPSLVAGCSQRHQCSS